MPVTIATEDGFPKHNLDTEAAARYLREKYDVPFSAKSLANRRCSRQPPEARYLGAKPYYRRETLDEFATKHCWADKSPHVLALERRKAAGLPLPKRRGPGRPRKIQPEARPDSGG
jgi:hypothetical protein